MWSLEAEATTSDVSEQKDNQHHENIIYIIRLIIWKIMAAADDIIRTTVSG
jgi:hypothetical protein